VLEAMALEVPIVATDVDGVREAVTHDREALVVPPRDPQRLADGIQTLLAAPELGRRLSTAAREKVERAFSFASRMRRVEEIYRRLLGTTTVDDPEMSQREAVPSEASGGDLASNAPLSNGVGF
jgi:glycosyltransferase involved in cell wall biosynthesis